MIVLVILVVPVCLAWERNDKSKENGFGSEKGMTLLNHVISSHDVTSPIDCSFLCTSHEKCKSYNYKPRGSGDNDICQLNNATRQTNPASYKPDAGFVHYFDQSEEFKSCLDYFRNGAKENGIYTITDTIGDSYPVFCDLTSEPRSAWTLILSFAFKNRHMPAFCDKPLTASSPIEENNPNWEVYRLSLGRLQRLSRASTHVRITTGFPDHDVDFRDYLRAKISNLDVLTSIYARCIKVEYIAIRQHHAKEAEVSFWNIQYSKFSGDFFHTDTSRKFCQFDGSHGSTAAENNFGTYCASDAANPDFRGCQTDDSTTNYWFGGQL